MQVPFTPLHTLLVDKQPEVTQAMEHNVQVVAGRK
jgi:hypothetical protein